LSDLIIFGREQSEVALLTPFSGRGTPVMARTLTKSQSFKKMWRTTPYDG
jgi:hypothetical protein